MKKFCFEPSIFISDKTSPNILFTPGLPTKFRDRPRVTWTSSEYARFECSLNDQGRFRLCGKGSRGDWSRTGVPAGVHDFFVRGTDRNGNVGPIANFRFSIGKCQSDLIFFQVWRLVAY